MSTNAHDLFQGHDPDDKYCICKGCLKKAGTQAPATPPDAGGLDSIMLRGATAMLDAIEREIPRNDADRDYADTVIQEFRSLRAKLTAAESRINDLEDAAARPKADAGGLGKAWNLLADAMNVLDALCTLGPSDEKRKESVHAKIEEAYGIVQKSMQPKANAGEVDITAEQEAFLPWWAKAEKEGAPARQAAWGAWLHRARIRSTPATKPVDPRPMKLHAEPSVWLGMSDLYITRESGPRLMWGSVAEDMAREIAYRINSFEAPPAGTTGIQP